MIELTNKEILTKTIMENIFVPIIHKIFEEASPLEYRMWRSNACRQTAIFGKKILEELLPEYDWTAWDGNFSDIIDGKRVKYNHAWIHGINKEKSKGLLVDLSRNHHERLFIPVEKNSYPKKHESYKHMRVISKERLDVETLLCEEEYYTKMKGRDLLEKIKKDMGM
ncbi:hypothetical protein [Bacillus pumilus]|uniref:hypothetical protein n=1 Tax=Bacillus pumilus TaxID=1408 RepID=UPI0011AA43D3|nr:hypothetical protein [Bacillus pumilus]